MGLFSNSKADEIARLKEEIKQLNEENDNLRRELEEALNQKRLLEEKSSFTEEQNHKLEIIDNMLVGNVNNVEEIAKFKREFRKT